MKENQYNSIAISGEGGSGKTTIAKALGIILGWEVFGAGELFREWCAENEIYNIGASSGNDRVHDVIDGMMRKKMLNGKAVVEGRVAALVAMELPGVMKVLLVCEAEERYNRILMRDPDKHSNIKLVRRETEQREQDNERVFSQRYGRSYLDQDGYDLVVDTGLVNIVETVGQISEKMGR